MDVTHSEEREEREELEGVDTRGAVEVSEANHPRRHLITRFSLKLLNRRELQARLGVVTRCGGSKTHPGMAARCQIQRPRCGC